MRMNRGEFLCCPVILFLYLQVVRGGDATPLLAPPPARVPTYRFTPIEPLPGYEHALVRDLDNTGRVVGSAQRVIVNPNIAIEQRAFIFENGTSLEIGTSEFHSSAEGINDLGHICGFDDDAQSSQVAFLSDRAETYQILGCCTAVDVNNNDQVIVFTGSESFLWENGALTNLGVLNPNNPRTEAVAINHAGQIVGTSRGPWIPTPPFFENRAFIWENGEMSELPLLGPGASGAVDINDLGQILGFSGGRIVLWRDGVVEDMTVAPFVLSSSANGFNNHLEIVGAKNIGIPPYTVYATVWREGGATYDLNRLIPPGTLWHLERSREVNDRGEIIGDARPMASPSVVHGFLLHPIDCDVNGDGGVEYYDLATFVPCLSGPEIGAATSCSSLEFDQDDDVDLIDYRSLELAFAAVGEP